jgi:ABC-2 type transport system permease protein
MAEISFEGLPADDDIIAPLAPSTLDSEQAGEFDQKLAYWPPGRLDDSGQSIRNLVSVAAVADLCADPRESEIGRLVFGKISSAFEPAVARQALAWIILYPEDGQALTKAPELGLFRHPPERLVRRRSVVYAGKYLGRLLGKIRD